jgi:dnd system-associated protein 4
METVKQQSGGRYRISIDRSHHSTYQELAKRPDKEISDEEKDTPPFESMKNLFMLATFIGYRNQKRVPLENKIDIFTWQVLATDEEYISLLYALAVTETDGVEVLTDRNEILNIAEEYANGGILQIEEEVKEMPGDKIENILDLLANWIPADSTQDSAKNPEH